MSINNTYHDHARNMSREDRASIALKALRKSTPITTLSNTHKVSRNFIHKQKNKAVAAVNKLFYNTKYNEDEEAVLFSIPVTKLWLRQVVICLSLHCKGSFCGLQKSIHDLMDYHVSIGTIGVWFAQARGVTFMITWLLRHKQSNEANASLLLQHESLRLVTHKAVQTLATR